MPRFSYTALDARGAEKSGLLDAPDIKQVAAILRGQGLFPTDVAAAGLAAAKPKVAKPVGKPRPPKAPVKAAATGRRPERGRLRLPFVRIVKPKELAVFTRQLSTLLRAGMPLLRGLEVLARQERNGSLPTQCSESPWPRPSSPAARCPRRWRSTRAFSTGSTST